MTILSPGAKLEVHNWARGYSVEQLRSEYKHHKDEYDNLRRMIVKDDPDILANPIRREYKKTNEGEDGEVWPPMGHDPIRMPQYRDNGDASVRFVVVSVSGLIITNLWVWSDEDLIIAAVKDINRPPSSRAFFLVNPNGITGATVTELWSMTWIHHLLPPSPLMDPSDVLLGRVPLHQVVAQCLECMCHLIWPADLEVARSKVMPTGGSTLVRHPLHLHRHQWMLILLAFPLQLVAKPNCHHFLFPKCRWLHRSRRLDTSPNHPSPSHQRPRLIPVPTERSMGSRTIPSPLLQ
jgi:hypothetical protein